MDWFASYSLLLVCLLLPYNASISTPTNVSTTSTPTGSASTGANTGGNSITPTPSNVGTASASIDSTPTRANARSNDTTSTPADISAASESTVSITGARTTVNTTVGPSIASTGADRGNISTTPTPSNINTTSPFIEPTFGALPDGFSDTTSTTESTPVDGSTATASTASAATDFLTAIVHLKASVLTHEEKDEDEILRALFSFVAQAQAPLQQSCEGCTLKIRSDPDKDLD
ncbi:uncharacterized protein LOC108883525 isoform X3 [Lates calcarifer]|uniref:Uncharacterized protein LOC108883525 isoform X2 n=1 Tax=Lates calcarifer TaxID=8187 RepID=A0AAJ8DP69_LATCA|nr:uncharacterized protein LOC108883525 isoform X2 [Lates calcarifer]XP_050926006.1 uncharacterized protein LOC108883525 isoform X3 [Lates calcarifer]